MAAKISFLMLLLSSTIISAQSGVTADNISAPLSTDRWKWTVFVKGDPKIIGQITCVQYELHPTFPDRFRRVCDRGCQPSQAFPLTDTGWGTFDIPVTITFADGHTETFKYPLRFDKNDSKTDRLINAPSFDKAPAFVRSIFMNGCATSARDSYEDLDDRAKAQLLNICAVIEQASLDDQDLANAWKQSSIIRVKQEYIILKTSRPLPVSLKSSTAYKHALDHLLGLPDLPGWNIFGTSFRTHGKTNLHITFLGNQSEPNFYYAELRIDLSRNPLTAGSMGHSAHDIYNALIRQKTHPAYSWLNN